MTFWETLDRYMLNHKPHLRFWRGRKGGGDAKKGLVIKCCFPSLPPRKIIFRQIAEKKNDEIWGVRRRGMKEATVLYDDTCGLSRRYAIQYMAWKITHLYFNSCFFCGRLQSCRPNFRQKSWSKREKPEFPSPPLPSRRPGNSGCFSAKRKWSRLSNS